MPTLPLMETLAGPNSDAPRLSVAPGGYQWWRFEAYDPAADLRVVVILFDGNPFHPKYLRRYAWYRLRPTRFVPPTPVEFPCVSVTIHERDVLVHRAMWKEAAGAWRATGQRISVGGDGFARQLDGSMRLTVRELLDLTFRPNAASGPAPTFRTMAAGRSVVEPHGWVVSNPSCAVTGEVTAGGRTMRFDGSGYQDHRFGAEPPSLAMRRWFWACAWTDDRSLVVAEIVPARGLSRGPELIGCDTPGSATWDGRTHWRIPFPTRVDFGDELRLDEPRVLDSSPLHVRLRYRAQVRGVTTIATAHVVEPGRAGWPILGRLIERAIDAVRAS